MHQFIRPFFLTTYVIYDMLNLLILCIWGFEIAPDTDGNFFTKNLLSRNNQFNMIEKKKKLCNAPCILIFHILLK